MCCHYCTTLKKAGMWGAYIHIGVGLLLLIGYFVIDEVLGDFLIPYLVYICILIPLGLVILYAVHKELECAVRTLAYLFVLNQLFGFGVRLLVPAQKTSWTILQRILVLFVSIIATAIYTAILFIYARKLRKARRMREEEEAAAREEEEAAAQNAAAGPPRSSIEDGDPP